MPVTDALGWVHGSPSTPAAFVTAASAYSTNELDFGPPVAGTSYPWLEAFPSLTEKGYTFPPEMPGASGVEWGLHLIVGVAFDTLTSINFQVCTSATTNATFNGTPLPIAARALTLAQLAIPGAHYFIPINSSSVLEFLRFYGALTGSPNVSGTLMGYFGPRAGGEQ